MAASGRWRSKSVDDGGLNHRPELVAQEPGIAFARLHEVRKHRAEMQIGERHGGSDEEGFDPDEDPLLDRAIEVVVTAQTASVSLLQRRLRVGYTRAGRLVDMLERRGIISPYEGSKPRRVLISEHELAQPADR